MIYDIFIDHLSIKIAQIWHDHDDRTNHDIGKKYAIAAVQSTLNHRFIIQTLPRSNPLLRHAGNSLDYYLCTLGSYRDQRHVCF